MKQIVRRNVKKMTSYDVFLASVYFSILVELAKSRKCVTYGKLVAIARDIHPDNESVRGAIAVSAGRRLEVIRRFTVLNGFPELTSIVINRDSGTSSLQGASEQFTLEAQLKAFEFNWSDCADEFSQYIAELNKSCQKNRKLTEDEALKKMFEFYLNHKDDFPQSLREHRESIKSLMMSGISAEDAFRTFACNT